jgi:hypothetical protein
MTMLHSASCKQCFAAYNAINVLAAYTPAHITYSELCVVAMFQRNPYIRRSECIYVFYLIMVHFMTLPYLRLYDVEW